MEKNVIIETGKNKYKLIKNYKEAFNKEEFLNKITPFFDAYDYILGDISYSKLRLKGFNKKSNRLCNEINDYSKVEKYLKENCAYECKYFILEKIKENKSEVKIKNNQKYKLIFK